METFRFLMATTFYPPYHIGGDAVHVQYLAEALAAQGHEVHVEFAPAAFRLKKGPATPPAPEETGVRVHSVPSPFGRAQPVSAYLLGRSRGVTRFHEALLRSVRPDVVHLHNISLLGLGVLRRPPSSLLLYTAHDYWARCPRSDLMKYGRRPCERAACMTCAVVSRRPPQVWRAGRAGRVLPGLDGAIAPSRFLARALSGHLTCPIVHIPHFAPDPNPAGAVSDPEEYFLFVGVLERHKGVAELAQAVSGPGRSWVRLVGSGSLAAALGARARAGARITLEGWMTHDRLQPLYRRAIALVAPSTGNEVSSLVAIEALAFGTPLLTSTNGGLPELLHDGTAGRSFGPGADALRRALDRFVEDGLGRELRAGARRAYETHHSQTTYLSRYHALIRDLAEGPRGVAARFEVRASTTGTPPVPMEAGGP